MQNSRSPGSDGTMSNSPVRRPGSNLARERESGSPRKSSTCLLPPESAAPTRLSSIGPDSNGPGSNGPTSLDSLPSVKRVGGSAPLNEGSQRQPESVALQSLTHSALIKNTNSEVNFKRSLTLVEQSERTPLSRRSYTLVEQSGTSAWI